MPSWTPVVREGIFIYGSFKTLDLHYLKEVGGHDTKKENSERHRAWWCEVAGLSCVG